MNDIEFLSVELGVISVIVARRYKKLGDKYNNDYRKNRANYR